MKYFIVAILMAIIISGFLAHGIYSLAQDIKGIETRLNTIQIQTAGQYCAVYDVPEICRDPRLKPKKGATR